MISAIVLKDINFSYDEEIILNIPSLSIKRGGKVFIHGPSGSGKSTLLNLIAGVIKPNFGSVSILGKNLGLLADHEKDRYRGDHIGFVFQSFNLIPYLTIFENILLPLKSSKIRFCNIRDNINNEIHRISDHLKIRDLLSNKSTDLSVGQQQRVAVARALIGNPEIIIADEPTSSLDEDITASFMKLLIEEHKEKNFTLVFVSHDKSLAKYFDREINFNDINGVE